ncbi:conserved hypothetical protein [Bacillus cereus AH820]|uniref:Uncharacterized protein n=1 Tax=Bacillus cereus (strain AH820) TaxID=405535 RepID=B7JSP0_BACC0|nr:conserved hypothetical protein [Bacillus cereus AH820]ACP12538.1 conserved hypothetical protein [Bacillus anthracis str. CDC 684]AFH84139.1 Hypothetical Protein H9401_2753 [Bacillus anthracis str. H9401]
MVSQSKCKNTYVKLSFLDSFFHYYNECYDLQNGKWISNGDKWFD